MMKVDDETRKEIISENTFILTLDGDVDFTPQCVHLLVDLMKKNRRLGAACGRIHPRGSGTFSFLSSVDLPRQKILSSLIVMFENVLLFLKKIQFDRFSFFFRGNFYKLFCFFIDIFHEIILKII